MITRNQRSILFSLNNLIIAIVFWIFLFKPIMLDFKKTFNNVKEINKKRNLVTGTVNSIEDMKKEKAVMEKELDEYNMRLPTEDKINSIISQISSKTGSLNVNINSISSGESSEIPDKPVIIKPIIINLECDFKTLSSYFNLIEEIQTALAIKKISIQKNPSLPSPQLSVSIQLETYISKGVN